MYPGETAFFDISLKTGYDVDTYTFSQRYDPWHWLRENRKTLLEGAAVLVLVSMQFLFMAFRPLWNMRIYQAIGVADIDKLAGIPWVGPPLYVIVKIGPIVPWAAQWFATRSRTLDAWVRSHSSLIERHWNQETLPAKTSGLMGTTADFASYVPLPVPNSGEMIYEPSANSFSSLVSSRTVIEIVGPGGVGKTTLARQLGFWALRGGRPGGFLKHPMIPVRIDEDLDPKDRTLASVVKGSLTALLPDEPLGEAVLAA